VNDERRNTDRNLIRTTLRQQQNTATATATAAAAAAALDLTSAYQQQRLQQLVAVGVDSRHSADSKQQMFSVHSFFFCLSVCPLRNSLQSLILFFLPSSPRKQ